MFHLWPKKLPIRAEMEDFLLSVNQCVISLMTACSEGAAKRRFGFFLLALV